MGEGDFMPMGSHRKKYDPKRAAAQAKKIKEGGKRAQKIQKETVAHQKNIEAPAAEAQLEKDLENLFVEERKELNKRPKNVIAL